MGGTIQDNWRDYLISKLEIDYFNPIVDKWDINARKIENEQKYECDFLLYVITENQKGFYTIAEIVDDCNNRPSKVIVCILKENMTKELLNNIESVLEIIKEHNPLKIYYNLDDVIKFLNLDGKFLN